MIVDASAVLAILFTEPDAQRFMDTLDATPDSRMSVVNFVEATMVLESRHGPEAGPVLVDFLAASGIGLAPVTLRQAELACDAWRRFGKGRRPRGLNLGDCFAYALAVDAGEPLLFKGDDFALTDITPA